MLRINFIYLELLLIIQILGFTIFVIKAGVTITVGHGHFPVNFICLVIFSLSIIALHFKTAICPDNNSVTVSPGKGVWLSIIYKRGVVICGRMYFSARSISQPGQEGDHTPFM